jgi:hypothetical protein
MRNIRMPNGEMIMTDCNNESCKRCTHIKTFEYPWLVQINDEQFVLNIKYCKHFSRWAQTPETKILLPEPLLIDKNKDCIRHYRCIQSDIEFANIEEESDEIKEN